MDDRGITFRWKDYRAKGRTKQKTMPVAPGEFIRRFLLHVLPSGFHSIRHYGLLANGQRREQIALASDLLNAPPPVPKATADAVQPQPTFVCPHCGAPMIVIDILVSQHRQRAPPPCARIST